MLKTCAEVFAVVLLLSGCGVETDRPTAKLVSALEADNGRSMNGVDLNGRSMNGRSMNGRSMNGVSLAGGVTLGGVKLLDVVVVGGSLTSPSRGLSGSGLAGAELVGTATDGTAFSVRIDSVRAASDPDIVLYRVSFTADGGRYPLCGVDGAGTPIDAIAVAGEWDYVTGARISSSASFVTFACRGVGAIAKCVDMGYKPWKKPASCTYSWCATLEATHQACTRMLRADYCGNGQAHTQDGWALNVSDKWRIQVDDRAAYKDVIWQFDAEWDAQGARCWNYVRTSDVLAAPSCTERAPYDCGNTFHFYGSTLLMNYRTKYY